MTALSDRTATRLLKMMRDHGYVQAATDNAGFRQLVLRDHATAERFADQNGSLLAGRIYRITAPGRAWLLRQEGQEGQKSAPFIRESTNAAPDLEGALRAAILALRSYEFGNAAPDLARSTADVGDDALRARGLAPATLGAAR